MGLNRGLIGKTYPQKSFQVEPGALLAYARATNEENPLILDGSMASPTFGVVWLLPAWLDVFFDGELLADANIGRMVHAGQDMTFLAPVGPGDTVRTEVHVAGVEDRGSGELLEFLCSSRNQDGVEVLRALSSYFFRGPPDPERVPAKPAPTSTPQAVLQQRFHVDRDQAIRYAQASGDHNPIHVDEEMAKAMGFPRTILHGLCVMAFAQQAVTSWLHGHSQDLHRLAVQFSKVVFPGDELTFVGWERQPVDGREALGFIMHNQRDEEVIRAGVAERRHPS